MAVEFSIAVLMGWGYTAVQADCQACQKMVQVPFRMLGVNPWETTVSDVAPRLRCKVCGTRPDHANVKAYRQSDVQIVSKDGTSGLQT